MRLAWEWLDSVLTLQDLNMVKSGEIIDFASFASL